MIATAEGSRSFRHPDGLAVAASRQSLRFESIPRFEDPPYRHQANGQEEDRHGQAHADTHVGDIVEAPAEAADQVDDGVEKGDRLPERRQHIDGVETTAEEDPQGFITEILGVKSQGFCTFLQA